MSFPLFSDPKSEIIERFGILNTLIEEDDHPWYGIPFPGTYVLDADGIITAKFFEANLALRENSDQLRRAALGERGCPSVVPNDPARIVAGRLR